MPETAIDENYCAIAGENNIWFAGEVFGVEPETESVPVEKTSYVVFGFSVFPPDTGHHPAPGFFIYNVCHYRAVLPADSFISFRNALLI